MLSTPYREEGETETEKSVLYKGTDKVLRKHKGGGHCQVSPGKAMDFRLPSPPVLGSSSVISGDSELAL